MGLSSYSRNWKVAWESESFSCFLLCQHKGNSFQGTPAFYFFGILQGIKGPNRIPLLPANIWNQYQAVNVCLDTFRHLLTRENWLPVSFVMNAEACQFICIVLNVFQIGSFEVCFKTGRLHWVRTLTRFSLRYFDKLRRRCAVASRFWSDSSALLNLCVKFQNKTQTCESDSNLTANWKT